MVRKYFDQITGTKASMYIDVNGTTHLIVYGKGCIALDNVYASESIASAVLHRRPGMWARFTMTEEERSIVKRKIFHFIRCYDTHTYTLPRVLKELLKYLTDEGYDVEVMDDTRRDHKDFRVDGRSFCLYRMKGWSEYQID